MYDNWGYPGLMEERVRLSEKLQEAEDNLTDYKADYATLVDQETIICALKVTATNTSENYDCIKYAASKIDDLCLNNDYVPGLQDLLDLTDIQSSASKVSTNASDYSDDLTDVCKEIDNLKEKLAGKIEEANQIITYYPGKIAYIDQVVRERFCAPE